MVEGSEVLIISVKPKYVRTVLKEVKGSLKETHLVVSIAAGVTLEQLKVISLLFFPASSVFLPVCLNSSCAPGRR